MNIAKGRSVLAATHAGFATGRSCRAVFSCGSQRGSRWPALRPPRSPGRYPAIPTVVRGQRLPESGRAGSVPPVPRGRRQPLRRRAALPRPYARVVALPRTGASRSLRWDTLFPAGEPRLPGEGSGCAWGKELGSERVIFFQKKPSSSSSRWPCGRW